MARIRWISGTAIAAALLAGVAVQPAAGQVASDQAAAIVDYPLINAVEFSFQDLPAIDFTVIEDTVIQLSNTSNELVVAHCFYENANSHCTNTGIVCLEPEACCELDTGCGVCVPGWNETDFLVRLTPRQPLGWRASEGVVDFPLDGVRRQGIGGSSNAGSRIPPLPENPFLGSLKCIAVDAVTGVPVDRNVLKGEATTELFIHIIIAVPPGTTDPGQALAEFIQLDPGAQTSQEAGETTVFDVRKYSAIGIPAISGAVDDDRTLVLGGEDPEYEGCPNVLILNHLFDFAENPVSEAPAETSLALVPCTQDLLRQEPGSAVVQYLVYNEFEQRFSTSRPMDCLQFQPLSTIDTTQPERSIFSAGVSGTLAGQTRMTAIGSGLLGVAVEGYGSVTVTVNDVRILGRSLRTAATNLHFQGDREEPDLITLP